jgi:hypothetical protein
LGEAGASYRVHGKNNWSSASTLDMVRLRELLLAIAHSYAEQKRLLEIRYNAEVREKRVSDLYFLTLRVASLKLDPSNHRWKDSLLLLCLRGCIVCITYPNLDVHKVARTLYALWFAAMLFAPKPLAKTLTEKLLYPATRGRILNESLAYLRWLRRIASKGNRM